MFRSIALTISVLSLFSFTHAVRVDARGSYQCCVNPTLPVLLDDTTDDGHIYCRYFDKQVPETITCGYSDVRDTPLSHNRS